MKLHYETILDEDEENSFLNSFTSTVKYSSALLIILGVSFFVSNTLLTTPSAFHADFAADGTKLKPSGGGSTAAKSGDTKGEYELIFSFNREGYDPISYLAKDSDSVYGYSVLADYIGVIEPYANNNLYVYNIDPNSDYTFKYTACPYDSSTQIASSSNCASGSLSKTSSEPINLSCKPYDEYQITIAKYIDDDETTTSTEVAVCMYVRRDIKSLNSDDLSATMDAMYQLWALSDSEGQEKYGSNFHSSNWLTSAHLFNSAQRDADHIHEGLGFLPQHIKITNYFEESIQAVDPSVSLPYWDYTYESGNLEDSYMFTEDTFGSIVSPVDTTWGWTYKDDSIADAAIPDGRWAQIKADTADVDDYLQNAFGYLRGPWNMNPSPYISRFAVKNVLFPSCSNYYDWLSMNDFIDFMETAPFAPHAAIHGDLGGTYGCDKFDDLLTNGLIKDESSQRVICKSWFSTLKELYRANYITPKDDCETRVFLDEEGITCGFECDDDQKDDMISTMKKLIKSTYVPHNISSSDWEGWRDFVCTGDGYRVFSGDQLESASPSDPSFWPIHPNLERLYHAKMMAGGFSTSTEWPTSAEDVCDKSTCYEEVYGGSGSYDECCAGHYEDDQLLDFVNHDFYSGYGPTNRETMDGSDPSSSKYTMTYIYDDFSWSHCSEDFESLMETLKGERRRTKRAK